MTDVAFRGKQTFWRRLAAAFFPERCCCCGEVIVCGQVVCSACADKLPSIEPPLCPLCGCEKKHCQCDRAHICHQYTQRCASPFVYEGVVKDAIGRFKFRRHYDASELFVIAMADVVQREYRGVSFDCVVNVPVHAETLREREYDQAEVLARGLAERLGIPYRAALKKPWTVSPQRQLPAERRSGNVLGAFEVREHACVNDQTILLVDDVSTTGATLDECAKMLRIAGARAVYAVTAALALTKDQKIT